MPVTIGAPLGAANGTSIVEVDPISRIEGHLGVKLQHSGGFVTEADVHGNLWRGFENFLVGREANDAITFVQRICGVCPVPHGLTSTYAVDSVLGYSQNHITFVESGAYGVPAKAVYIRNLVLGAEFLMSSITHFYHLAAPSYVQGPAIPPWTPYFANSYYHDALESGGRAAPQNSGGFSVDVRELQAEGLIIPVVKLAHRGCLRDDVIAACAAGTTPASSAWATSTRLR